MTEKPGAASKQEMRAQLFGWGMMWSNWDFPGGSVSKNPPANAGDGIRSLGLDGPLEEGNATHSSILDSRAPWAEEPGGLQSVGSHRVRHD